MTVEGVFVARAKANAGLLALVSTRVWQQILPQSPMLPAVRVQLIDEVPSRHLRGPVGCKPYRIQTDVYVRATTAEPYTDAAAIMEALVGAVTPRPFTMLGLRVGSVEPKGRSPLFDAGEINAVRMQQDFIVWSKVA